MIAIPVLLGLQAIPLERWWGGPIAAFGFAFCGVGSLTNQIHRWSHYAVGASSGPRACPIVGRPPTVWCATAMCRPGGSSNSSTPYGSDSERRSETAGEAIAWR